VGIGQVHTQLNGRLETFIPVIVGGLERHKEAVTIVNLKF
jgi:hypothetical protein